MTKKELIATATAGHVFKRGRPSTGEVTLYQLRVPSPMAMALKERAKKRKLGLPVIRREAYQLYLDGNTFTIDGGK